jgi:hypothetical protein
MKATLRLPNLFGHVSIQIRQASRKLKSRRIGFTNREIRLPDEKRDGKQGSEQKEVRMKEGCNIRTKV